VLRFETIEFGEESSRDNVGAEAWDHVCPNRGRIATIRLTALGDLVVNMNLNVLYGLQPKNIEQAVGHCVVSTPNSLYASVRRSNPISGLPFFFLLSVLIGAIDADST
jgi:hypothetical protein